MENKIACKICGHESEKSIQAHINRFHGISRDEYVGRYPGASILSDSFFKEISDKNRELATRPGWSDKVSEGVKKLWQDPVYKKEHSIAVTAPTTKVMAQMSLDLLRLTASRSLNRLQPESEYL